MKKCLIKKEICEPNSLCSPSAYGKSFSRGIKITAGPTAFIFLSGTASIDKKGNTYKPFNFPAQIKRTFDNLTALLKSEGATWSDVIKTECFLKSMKYYKEFNIFRNSFYKKHALKVFPASFCIETNLCRRDLLIEISLLAITKK
jgi:2-iminobutanoate/2-iminopropanoate deaminase